MGKLEADDHEEYEDIPQEDNNTSMQQDVESHWNTHRSMSKSVSTINRPYLKIIKVKQEPDQNQDGSEEPKLEEFLKNEDSSNAYQIYCEMCDLTMLKTNVWR